MSVSEAVAVLSRFRIEIRIWIPVVYVQYCGGIV